MFSVFVIASFKLLPSVNRFPSKCRSNGFFLFIPLSQEGNLFLKRLSHFQFILVFGLHWGFAESDAKLTTAWCHGGSLWVRFSQREASAFLCVLLSLDIFVFAVKSRKSLGSITRLAYSSPSWVQNCFLSVKFSLQLVYWWSQCRQPYVCSRYHQLCGMKKRKVPPVFCWKMILRLKSIFIEFLLISDKSHG